MADASFVQASFLGGQWSKFAQGNFAIPEYRTAMNICYNSIPIEPGPVVRRPGCARASTTRKGQKARIIKFDFEESNAYTMEFTPGYLRFFTGTQVVTTDDPQYVSGVSSASPAEVTTLAAHGWSTGDEVYFEHLHTSASIIQNRTFDITVINSTNFTIVDDVTGDLINGTSVGGLPSGATVNRVLNIPTPYTGTLWSQVRSIQSNLQSVLVCPTVPPQMLTVTNPPTNSQFAEFSFDPVVFLDGPYLDPPTTGIVMTPTLLGGNTTVSLVAQLWSSTVSYTLGDLVIYNGNTYQSIIDANYAFEPDINPSEWEYASPGSTINAGQGFVQSDVGRLIRLLSEPQDWASGATYSAGAVVAYNPSGIPGNTTYWQCLSNGNNNIIPGTAPNWWSLAPVGSFTWTWGRITSLNNLLNGNVAGSTLLGNMSSNGGLAAGFGGPLYKQAYACAAYSASASSLDGYIGYALSVPSVITAGVYWPSQDDGYGVASVTSVTVNLRASNSLPSSPTDGTVIGTQTFANTNSFVEVSSTSATAWSYVWMEVDVSFSANTSHTIFCGQVQFFGSNGQALVNSINVSILGPNLLYQAGINTWQLGVYSNTTGWPTCGTYSDGRVWLSGAVPNRVDSSVSNGIVGNTIDFAPTDPTGAVGDASGISYTFNAPDVNSIFWMTPDLQGIVAGTQAGEWVIQAPTSGGITPTNISARQVTKIGCANIEPRRAEHTLVFVQRFTRKLMEYFADVFSGKFTAPNLSLRAKDITKPGIHDIAYQQELAPIIWALMADGSLAGCTYKRDTLMTSQGPTFYGWHQHALGGPQRSVVSIAVGPSVGGTTDSLSLVVLDGTTGHYHVEVLQAIVDEGETLQGASYLDDVLAPSGYIISTTPTSGAPYGGVTLTGLWPQQGNTVTAWLNGLDCGDYLVSGTGTIFVPFGDGYGAGTGGGAGLFTLQTAQVGNFPMQVGYNYISKGQIVRAATPQESGARSGPALGKKRRTMQFAALLEGTGQGLWFGTDFAATLKPANFTISSGSQYLSPAQLFSGVWWDTISSESDFDSMLCWEVNRPYPANIVALSVFLSTQDK